MKKSHFLGVGSYLPKKILTNQDLEKVVDTSDEWITKRTGIKARRIANGQSTADLAFHASKNCLINSGDFKVEGLDAIIVATCTPDRKMPSVANIVQGELGACNAFSFDLNAACSGFVYALSVVDALIKTGKASNILLIGVDVMSRIVDWSDRNTCVLFGDGAGAVLFSSRCGQDIENDTSGIFYDELYCDASLKNFLQTNNDGKIAMDGKKVFESAIKKLTTTIKDMFIKYEFCAQDIDYFIMHQANIRIIDSVAKRLGIKERQLIFTIGKFANTSAATIPITLDFAMQNNKLKKGSKVLIAAMGAGFTWGACLIVI